jgi:single-strand DNA-binding protein
MSGVNKVLLIGNLGRDPEVKSIESGVKVATFSLATTEVYKDKSGARAEHTEWHNVVVWRGLAELAEKYLKKGSQIYLEGKLRTRSWDDKEGVKRYTTEIIADTFTFLGKPAENGGANRPPVSNDEPQATPIAEDEGDLPF